MSRPVDDFFRGVRDVLPGSLGLVPYAIVVGVTLVNLGIPIFEGITMSILFFAGAAQLAALDLMSHQASPIVIVLAAIVVNLRLMMYSASIAPYFQEFTTRWKWLSAYLLADVNYAVFISEYDADSHHKRWYYVGTGLGLWTLWQGAIVLGLLIGVGIPANLQLGFAAPLVFVALLVKSIDDIASFLAAAVAGMFSIVAVDVPLDLGLIVASVLGIVAAMVAERHFVGYDRPQEEA